MFSGCLRLVASDQLPAVVLGAVRTAQKCEVDILGYLTQLFERRGSHRKRFGMTTAELTAMAYRELSSPGVVRAA